MLYYFLWDFRLKWVLSISVSGHKFGLVYPGLGWVCWKGKEYLPEEMSFSVNYLGANITQVGLNFSRPAAQILGQYYQFILQVIQGPFGGLCILRFQVPDEQRVHYFIGIINERSHFSDFVVDILGDCERIVLYFFVPLES